jgi:hypothetical protein
MKTPARFVRIASLSAAVLAIASAPLVADQAAPGWKPLFDGKTLEGWSCPEMKYWSVQDGAITAESSEANPCPQNQFLVWQHGEVDDFELKLKFRIFGSDKANSGIQIRSAIKPEDGHLYGYQCDMDRAKGWLGALYDEHTGRRVLAPRGKSVSITPQGKRSEKDLGDPATLVEGIDVEQWNEYHIKAAGSVITISINGKVTAKVDDKEISGYDAKGLLALQIHSGPPMKVQFKDIQLKRLPLSDGRKKIVFLSGIPSHPPRTHEHRAGCWLLAKCLNDYNADKALATVYYDQGWPADQTAFDNADAVVIYSDGNAKHPLMENLELWSKIDKRGVGLGCIHYAVEVPTGDPADALRNFIGGVFETYYSVNPHWVGKFDIKPTHPITRGVAPYEINDEWYYHMRFREGMAGVTPILVSTPPDETRTFRWGHHHGGNAHVKKRMGMAETVMWASENPTGSRGFGFTGGHYHDNWANNSHRKVVLNAILWAAKGNVPVTGVPSSVSKEDLNTNLDNKPEKKPRKPKKAKAKAAKK